MMQTGWGWPWPRFQLPVLYPLAITTSCQLSTCFYSCLVTQTCLYLQLREDIQAFRNTILPWKLVILPWERFQLESSHCEHSCSASVMRLILQYTVKDVRIQTTLHVHSFIWRPSIYRACPIHWMKNWISDLPCVHELWHSNFMWDR